MNHDEEMSAAAANTLVRICHSRAFEAKWWHDKKTGLDLRQVINEPADEFEALLGKALVAQKIALIHSEVSEAMEGHRKNRMDDHLPHRRAIEVELADAIIRICDTAGAMGLDLGGALAEKLAYNAVRPDHKVEAREAAGGKGY